MATIANTHLLKRPSPLVHESLYLVPSITSLLQKTLNPQANTNPPDPSNILNQFSPHLTPELVIRVIKDQANPHHALYFFNWASNLNPNPCKYFHTHHCYIAITDKLISNKLFSSAEKLLESRNRFSDFMVGKFIKAHGDLGHLRWVVKLFHRVKEREYGYCLFSYNSLLGVLVKARRIRFAWGYFGQMIKECVVKPDVSTYTTMIRGFCVVGMIDDAQKLFDEMGCEKNLVAYNTMVNGFCKKGLMENACKIFDEMVESGVCIPDMVTFSTLIDGYSKKGEMDKAMRCFDEMSKRNVEPNVVTYNALINGLCMIRDLEEAKKMMIRMRFSGLKSNVSTHTSLLKGYCAAGRSDEAIEHFNEMVRMRLELDEKSYAVIINEYCKLRKPYRAIDILKEMKKKGINPVTYACNAVLRSLIELGELDEAVHLLKKMPRMGCCPNFLSYSEVIVGLVRAEGQMRNVEMVVSDMSQDGKRLDATLYNELIWGYCREGNEEMSIKVFLKMIDEGYVINLECFEVVAKELIAKGKSFEIEYLFEQMKQKCPITEIHGYQKVLDGCFR